MWLQSLAPLPAPIPLSDHGQKVTDCLTLPRLRLLHHGGADLPPELRAKVHASSCKALIWDLITTMSQVANAEGTAAAMRADLEKALVPRSTPRVRPEHGLHNTGEQLGRRAGLRPAWSQLPSRQEGAPC